MSLAIIPRYPQCRFEDGEAIAAFLMDRGCLVYPDDRIQSLCLHHAMRANPYGSMELVADYSEGEEFRKCWK